MQNDNGRQKGTYWALIIFSSKVINFEHFVQTSTVTKLFIKVQIWVIQNLDLKVQSSQLSVINSNPIFCMWFHQFDTFLSHFEFARLP